MTVPVNVVDQQLKMNAVYEVVTIVLVKIVPVYLMVMQNLMPVAFVVVMDLMILDAAVLNLVHLAVIMYVVLL